MNSLHNNQYTCYNGKYKERLSDFQVDILLKLLSGEITRQKLAELRGNARRYKNLKKSIELSTVNEIYKYEVKHVK